ncbi:hypothetical protein [Nonomuraea fuscirosea]|uniref:hypothetical protein n=1 Tax=Nonomuraea fuscirosea TaxID=1291556 RepID=UPI0034210381
MGGDEDAAGGGGAWYDRDDVEDASGGDGFAPLAARCDAYRFLYFGLQAEPS